MVDRLRPELTGISRASIDGLYFFPTNLSVEFGRRYAVREFYGRDEVIADDLGRKRRTFKMDAMIIGDNYQDRRDALREKLEQPGIKTFFNPKYGEVFVVCTSSGTTETISSQGMATFNIELVEVSTDRLPAIRRNKGLASQTSGKAASLQSQLDFADVFDVLNAPQQIRTSINSAVGRSLNLMGDINQTLRANAGVFDSVANAISLFSSSVSGALLSPSGFAGSFAGIAESVFNIAETTRNSAQALLDAISDVFGFNAEDRENSTTDGPTLNEGSIEQVNKRSYNDLFYSVTFTEICKASSRIEYESRQQANEVKDALLEKFEFLDGRLGDDAREKFLVMKPEVIGYLDDVTANLPSIVSHVPAKALSIITITHQVYSDLDKLEDVETRNNIPNPLMITQPLEVLV